MIKGRDLNIYSGNKVIAMSRSCEIDEQCDVKEVSSPASGKARTFKAGRSTWGIQLQFLVSADATVKDHLQKVGETYTISFKRNGDASDVMTGEAICTQCKITATLGNLLQGTFIFQGSGPLA